MDFCKSYNRQEFFGFLTNHFLPEDFEKEDTPLSLVTKTQYIQSATRLGKSDSLDLVVYEVRHTSTHDARIGLTKEAFRLLADEWQSKALVLFVPQNDMNSYRFSFITINFNIDSNGKLTKEYSSPKRYSYLFGTSIVGQHTPQEYLVKKGRVKNIDDLIKRFDVETLTKEFYNKLYAWYEWACDNETGVTFPNKVSTADDDRENINVKMIRLITRMLFVWFIKQKKLVPDTIFNETELVSILKDFNPKAADNGCYYNAILQNLFFATINRAVIDSEGNRRSFATAKNQHDVRNLYRYAEMFCISEDEVIELFEKVPFLNGGLFECLDKFQKTDLLKEEDVLDDGFSRNSTRSGNGNYKYRAFIPNILFFNDDETHLGLINLFKRYNFTIEENAPNDVDVSLDPELLGKVFENLLASYNPETQASARKSTGSFYTPREIVDYMVDQSLIAHVSQHCPSIDKEKLSTFITNLDTPEVFSDEEKCQIVEALRTIKILDPACGSGAFPMGCLRHIVDTIERLRPTQTDRYQLKLDIIENCIYGVDIQPIAMLISKLRFFISLICDQHDIDFDDPENNYGINTLPNLETKFVAANTLISAQIRSYGTDFVDKGLKKLLDDLLEIRHEHFSAKSQYAKKKYREADESKRKEIEEYIIKNSYTPNEDLIKMLEQQIRESEANLLKYQGENWIDETQGSQTELFGPYNKTIFHVDKNEEKRKELKKNISACRSQITKEKGKTIPQGFEAAVHEVTQWNPYDQNAVSPFFDPEWMFGVKEGFDIVIGNPPYLKELGNEHIFAPINNSAFGKKYHTGKMDFWYYFLHRSIELIKPLASVSFITSRYWINSKGAKKLISHINKEMSFVDIVDIGNIKVFDNVVGYHMVYLLQKTKKVKYCNYKSIEDSVKHIESKDFSQEFPIPNESIISNTFEIQLNNNPLKKYKCELGDICHVSQGIVEASDKISSKMYKKNPNPNFNIGDGIFVLSKHELDQMNLTEEEKSILELFEDEGCISRYYINYDRTRYLIYADSINRNKIQNNTNFKNIKAHLDRMSEYITSSYKPYGLHRPRNYSDFIDHKIIGPCMFAHPCYSYDERHLFVGMSFVILSSFSNADPLFVLGLLNSSFADHWFNFNAKHRGIGVDVGVEKLRTFPIPTFDKNQELSIVKMVKQILSAKHSNPQTDTKAMEDEIDLLVYHLYGLNYDDVLVVDQETK